MECDSNFTAGQLYLIENSSQLRKKSTNDRRDGKKEDFKNVVVENFQIVLAALN